MLDELFTSRLKLMIIMARAYTEGCPLGQPRRRAMLENARIVEAECIDMGLFESGPKHAFDQILGNTGCDHLFCHRIKLIIAMVKAVAEGYPLNAHQKAELREHLSTICQSLMFKPGDWIVLKWA